MILNLILGDQLDRNSTLFDDVDLSCNHFWMAEVRDESTHVWSHKARTTYFLSCMRHFRDELLARNLPLLYSTLTDNQGAHGFREVLLRDIARLRPSKLRVLLPGEYRVLLLLQSVAESCHLPLEILEDNHFACSPKRFAEHAQGRKQLRMEYFYREMRREHGLLLQADGHPEGGEWNYDAANRKPFPVKGPPPIPDSPPFRPDALTREVIEDVERFFPNHPGSTAAFNWPVTPAQAETALQDFLQHRLPSFGDHQDAMWTDQPFLFHARLAAALNLKLLSPLHVCREAEKAWRADPDRISLASVEGFIRQILGWREYVRGVYFLYMPGYLDRNALSATQPLPPWFWTGETEMNCLRQVIGQTLDTAYAHHIQRLMVTGLFALLLGVNPREVHAWYLAVYIDAVEWVELPNTLGMSQYADGGIMASKPYIASGKYIDRMSNYCKGCRFRPELRSGPDACPFTLLYWDFLDRHSSRLAANPRMSMQLKNLARISDEERDRIRSQAASFRQTLNPPTS